MDQVSDDLLSILTGKPATKAPKAAATYDPLDAAVRTVIAEESDPEARQWVAGVIRNRAKAKNGDLLAVVREKGQFEPWADEANKIAKIDPNSDDYKKTAALVGPILRGEVDDPTGGATHFYAPQLQADLKRDKPEWDDGSGVQKGRSLFFRINDQGGGSELANVLGVKSDMAQADADFAKAFGDPAKYDKAEMISRGVTPFRELKDGGKVAGVLSKEQEELYKALNKGGGYKPNDPEGSPYNMLFMQEGISEKDIPPGAYYVTRGGEFKRAPGGEDKDASPVKGFGQGAADVALSVANLMPGSEDSTIKSRLLTDQMVYDAEHKGELGAGLGRFAGQTAAALPVMAGVEAAALPAIGGSALGRFALGKAGAEMAPGVGRAATRLASRVTQGAAEGAGGAALVSSASDEPLADQMKTGALVGGVLRPAVPLAAKAGEKVGSAVRGMVEPWTYSGREKGIDRLVGQLAPDGYIPDLREIIPGVQPTLGEASGNAGIASLERNARSNPKLSEMFAKRDEANAEARSAFLENARGDEQTVADLSRSRRAEVGRARAEVFSRAQPTNPQTAIQAIDAALESPEAHMEAVARPLQSLRDKISRPPAETTPEQARAFNQAVARSFGAPNLSPEGMSAARAALGRRFEEIASNTTVPWDDGLRQSIGQIIRDTAQVVPDSSLPPLFRQLDNIASTADSDAISGASYQALTKKGAPLSSLQSAGDPTIRDAANRIREALDDALERSLGAQEGAESSLASLRDARLAYKNLKTVEGALKSAGPDRVLSPQAVMSAVKRNFGQFAYQGGGPLGDAAEAALREQASRPPRLETDPHQLFGMRESLSTAITKLEKEGSDASQLAADRLRTVRDSLDQTIEGGAPGYRQFVELAERTQQPIEATRFLQSLKLTDMRGNVTLAKIDGALKRIGDMRAKPGDNPAKMVSEESLRQLEALRDDLLRADSVMRGKAKGSDTVQNFMTGKMAEDGGVPVALGATLGRIPGGNLVAGAATKAISERNDKMLGQLSSRLLNPSEMPLKNVTLKKRPPVIPVGDVALPVIGGQFSSSVGANK